MANRSKRVLRGFSIPIFLILLATIPYYVPDYYVSLLVSVYLYVILTVSWAMFSAPTGYMSLATATFFGIGIYTVAVLGETMPLFILICLGGLFSFLIALLVGLACMRLKGIYFAIFTFGLTELILHALLFYELEVTGQVGRLVVELDAMIVYYAMLFIVVIVLLTVFIFKHSKYGFALQGIGQAEVAAACIGVNVNWLKIIVFAISGFFMGLAGAIMVTQWTYVDSRTAFNMLYSFMPALMALFGGARQIHGQVLGAVVLTLLTETLLIKFPYYYMLLFGVLIVTIILYSPSGLVGLFESAKSKFRGVSGKTYGPT